MSIENTRLVIGSAKRDGIGGRETPPPVCLAIVPVSPVDQSGGDIFYYDPVTGQPVQAIPSFVGQMIAYQDSANPNYVQLFIADSNLQWVKVNMTSFLIDVNTGKPYDPNAQFYNPLAS
jgi:hypothetical protein